MKWYFLNHASGKVLAHLRQWNSTLSTAPVGSYFLKCTSGIVLSEVFLCYDPSPPIVYPSLSILYLPPVTLSLPLILHHLIAVPRPLRRGQIRVRSLQRRLDEFKSHVRADKNPDLTVSAPHKTSEWNEPFSIGKNYNIHQVWSQQTRDLHSGRSPTYSLL